jgi:hypothetical protein
MPPASKNSRFRPLISLGRLVACAASFCLLAVNLAWAGPAIINFPFTAKPGDVFSLEGSGFGAAPKVYLKPSLQTAAIALPTKAAQDDVVVVEVPKTIPFDSYNVWIVNGSATSSPVALNAPLPQHFDGPDVASGARFRIYGRNLYVNGATPTVTLIDAQTKAQLKASVATASSGPYYLDVAAPGGVIAGHVYSASVSNGYATATTSGVTLLGHASGTDYFGIGQPWAYDFVYADGPNYKAGVAGTNVADHHVFNAKTDPSLSLHAKGDGTTNDAAAINAAIVAASANGGVVYLPAGTYNTGTTTLHMASNVVLQGSGQGSTKIIFFGPAGPGGIYFPAGTQMSGLADMSLQNTDLSSKYLVNLNTGNAAVSKVFLQRLNWNFGSGKGLLMSGDRISIQNSTFVQAINYQNGNAAAKTGGLGPTYLSAITNLQFRNNAVKWATGQNALKDIVNAVIENNVFTRSASDTAIAGPADLGMTVFGRPVQVGDRIQRIMGRQVAINFGKNVVFNGNTFNVSDGTLSYNWNDGETIQNEAGATNPRDDSGVITSVSATSVADNSKCSGTCAWRYYPGYSMIVVVSGAGAGQWRRIVANAGNTFTVDRPFNVVPAVGDHFTISYPAYENALIINNRMNDNPLGVDIYHGSMLNVSVINNTLTNNGGIELVGAQRNPSPGAPAGSYFAGMNAPFAVSRNIEISGNILTNTKGLYPSYIAAIFTLNTQNTFWGKSAIGVEVRNNQITARPGTALYRNYEGYKNNNYYQSSAPYVDKGGGALIGTVFQGDKCTNCQGDYVVTTGTIATAIWNPISVTSPGLTSTLLLDWAFNAGTKTRSTATVVGND